MPGNSVIRDKTNERHGLFWGIESCDVTHYSASTARRQHSESRYGTEQGSPRITLGSLCQELQHRCNVMVEIMHPVDHEVQSLYHFITESPRLASISSCRAFWLKEPARMGNPHA